MRWHAALSEMLAYRAVPEAQRLRITRQLGSAIQQAIDGSPRLEPVAGRRRPSTIGPQLCSRSASCRRMRPAVTGPWRSRPPAKSGAGCGRTSARGCRRGSAGRTAARGAGLPHRPAVSARQPRRRAGRGAPDLHRRAPDHPGRLRSGARQEPRAAARAPERTGADRDREGRPDRPPLRSSERVTRPRAAFGSRSSRLNRARPCVPRAGA